ncbi:MAG: DUF4331 domain-containing protein [Verrucomicrobiota bacterium]|nr:DUF4331 domain-containing protein [Verrucomicrobiota bacterium]
MKLKKTLIITTVCIAGAIAFPVLASSHREAPMITSSPKLDGTDFYMFNSYETNRQNFVTIVANYIPLQDAYGGPNYFQLDTNAVYEIQIDNNGNAAEDITFQFRFTNVFKNISLPIGPVGNQRTNSIPLINAGQITATNDSALNVIQQYTVNIIRGPRRTGTSTPIANAANSSTVFTKPVDNIGNKSLPDYDAYANQYIYSINIPGSATPGRMFVGQRKDPFVVNLGETFDLINYSNPLGPVDGAKDSLADKNVTSLILEIPKSALVGATNGIIAGWTTASKIEGTNIVQVSRLGQPLVNEVVIGLRDKDKFNASEPSGDPQFIDYVTHPTLPALIEILFGSAGVRAPTNFPRTDLVAVFLTGVTGLNADGGVGELLRLNTGIAAVPAASQNNLGVIAGDNAGFPNGRRPGDDIVDIALRVVMGKLLGTNDAPSGQLPFTDGALVNASMFKQVFPYLNTPLPGSPNSPSITITLQSSAQVQGPYMNRMASYNTNTGIVSGPKETGPNGFYRLKSDTSGLRLTQFAVASTNVTFSVTK